MKKKINLATKIKIAMVSTVLLITPCILSGCAGIGADVAKMEGSIIGNTYDAMFYSNSGEKFMTVRGEKIDINENTVTELTHNTDGSWGYTNTLSSVITITIDGNEISSCGSTIIFAENGLKPDVDYIQKDIESRANGFGDNTFIANKVNYYKNLIGKPIVVVIQSQLGDPICAYSGNKVYYEVCQDLPKTTMLYIDGKLLYIHRANFQIIDKALLIDDYE